MTVAELIELLKQEPQDNPVILMVGNNFADCEEVGGDDRDETVLSD